MGEVVTLSTTEAADRTSLIEIRRSPQVWARWRGEDLEAEFDEDLGDAETTQLTIRERDKDRIVGLIQFHEETDPEYRHASIDIYVDPDRHRRGIASDAISSLVAHLFEHRGHHRLTIDPAADNEAATACYGKVGFRPVGVMHQYERQPNGSWADGLLMELLRSDWAG